MAELADRFGRIDIPVDVHLTIVPHLNPDGWAAGTRHNGDGVDLNRNFPWGWRRGGFAGRRPASEPETAAAMGFLTGERPDLVIWVHQPLAYVSAIDGCPQDYADLWSQISGVPVRRNLRQFGGGETWTGVDLGLRALLVEVGGTKTEASAVTQHAKALLTMVEAT